MSDPKKSSESNVKALLAEADQLRRLAFVGVLVSTIATLTAVVGVPMLYNYTQYVRSSLHDELEFCTRTTKGLYEEFDKFETSHGAAGRPKRDAPLRNQFIIAGAPGGIVSASYAPTATLRRFGRQGGYGASALAAGYAASGVAAPAEYALGYGPQDKPASATASYDGAGGHTSQTQTYTQEQCCSCGIGAAGPPGTAGEPGADGHDGQPGKDGAPGEDGSQNAAKVPELCFYCADAPAGPAGKAGPKGPPGPAGQPGSSPSSATPGAQGPPGPPGSAGQPGASGEAGQPGQDGQLDQAPGIPGPVGSPGLPGSVGSSGEPGTVGKRTPGPQGPPGDVGEPGKPGQAGEPGSSGDAGKDGPRGSCDHCPPPRTAPGY